MSKSQHQRSQFIMLFFAFSFGMILSNLIGQSAPKEPELEVPSVVMVYRGIDKTVDDLPEPVVTEYRTLSEQTKAKQRELLYNVALQWQLEEYAVKQQLSLEEAGNQLFKLSPPTEQDVNAFYLTRADKIGKPFYEVREQIFQHLSRQQALNARADKIAALIERGDLALFLD